MITRRTITLARNYGYISYGEPYIICTNCGAECMLHDSNYECSVCGYDGWDGEEKINFSHDDNE